MRIDKIKTIAVHFTAEEICALRMADSILHDLQDGMGCLWSRITATDSGESIDEEEIARVRGILSGLADHGVWQVE